MLDNPFFSFSGQCAKFLDDQTILHWQSYTRKRARLVENAVNVNAASAAATPASHVGSINAAQSQNLSK